jgi:hypothetical protein
MNLFHPPNLILKNGLVRIIKPAGALPVLIVRY